MLCPGELSAPAVGAGANECELNRSDSVSAKGGGVLGIMEPFTCVEAPLVCQRLNAGQADVAHGGQQGLGSVHM